jgi:hypothetical protein
MIATTVKTGRLTDAKSALAFILAGNATVTLRSVLTGTRYTYKVRQSKDKPFHFVKLLTGANNESDYEYLGIIRNGVFKLTGKSRMTMTSLPVKAFAWTLAKLAANDLPNTLEIWHEGRCGRCGRKLTVPSSIVTGFGPECSDALGIPYDPHEASLRLPYAPDLSALIEEKIARLKDEAPENYYRDGEMNDTQAHEFWYHHFEKQLKEL